VSDYANPDLARLWLDGDAFRAPASTALPADIFANELTGWDAFGGIKAGFVITTDREITDVNVWNNTSGSPYKRRKQPPATTIALRPVDYSKATVLTLLRGGSVAETATASGIWEMIEGEDEQFGLILRVVDGDKRKAYYIAKGELVNVPEENMGADDDVEGWDLEIGPLAPGGGAKAVRKFLTENPLVATP
jgi:hypothetical protein